MFTKSVSNKLNLKFSAETLDLDDYNRGLDLGKTKSVTFLKILRKKRLDNYFKKYRSSDISLHIYTRVNKLFNLFNFLEDFRNIFKNLYLIFFVLVIVVVSIYLFDC